MHKYIYFAMFIIWQRISFDVNNHTNINDDYKYAHKNLEKIFYLKIYIINMTMHKCKIQYCLHKRLSGSKNKKYSSFYYQIVYKVE